MAAISANVNIVLFGFVMLYRFQKCIIKFANLP